MTHHFRFGIALCFIVFFSGLANEGQDAKTDHTKTTMQTTQTTPASQIPREESEAISLEAFAVRINQELKKTGRISSLRTALDDISAIVIKNRTEFEKFTWAPKSDEWDVKGFANHVDHQHTLGEAAVALGKLLETDGTFGKITFEISDDNEGVPLLLLSHGGMNYVLAVTAPPLKFSLAKNIELRQRGASLEQAKTLPVRPTSTLHSDSIKMKDLVPNRVLPDGRSTNDLKDSRMAAQLHWTFGEDTYRVFYSSLRRNVGFMHPDMSFYFDSQLGIKLTPAQVEAIRPKIDWTIPRTRR